MTDVDRSGLGLLGHARWRELEPLLDAALDLDPERRATYVETACPDDPVLRAELERVLRSCQEAEGFLVRSGPEACAGLLADLGAAALGEGTHVGPYRVLRELGHGGMGAVYLADRADGQFEQQVALKLVRGALSPGDHLVRRFLEERQILAALQHPHIARLLDGGLTADGFPWFAMEYVEGTPIDRYCDAHRLSIDQRLHLFLTVCEAVQHAHQSLVVHRDLKPSNILVTGAGLVKLLDFGIAKLISSAEGEQPTTETLTRALTPDFASPEQIRGEVVTTASDVYSLGVVLYQLLSGQRPYRVTGRSAYEIERVVLETQAERPSGVVTRMGAEAAPARATTPDRLRRRLRGDLDTIVMKALRKEPERRYGSVDQLATDLHRHLDRLPVGARGDSLGYRAGKFVRRHRLGVGAAIGFGLLLIGASLVTQVQSARTARERDKAERLSGFLADLFGAPEPWEGRGASVTVREMLDSGAARVNRELVNQPEVRADVLAVMGRSYWGLGLFDRARHVLDSAIEVRRRAGGNAAAIASAQHLLARVTADDGAYAQADSIGRESLTTYRQLYRPSDPRLVAPLLELGDVLRVTGRLEEAEPLIREALAIQRAQRPVEPLRLAVPVNDLGHVLRDRGDFAGAEVLYSEALKLRRSVLGEEHPDVGNLLINLAMVRHHRGDSAAVSLFSKGLELKRRVFGDQHPEIALDRTGLATILMERGEVAAAESLYRAALTVQRRLFPPVHIRTAQTLAGLGRVRLARGDPASAEPILRDAVGMLRAIRSPGDWQIADTESALGACLAALGRYDEAASLLRSSYLTLKATRGDRSPETVRAAQALRALEARGSPR